MDSEPRPESCAAGEAQPPLGDGDHTACLMPPDASAPARSRGFSRGRRWRLVLGLGVAPLALLALGAAALRMGGRAGTVVPAAAKGVVTLDSSVQDKPKKGGMTVRVEDVSEEVPADCPADASKPLENCVLIVVLHKDVNHSGLHLFARSFISSKQVQVDEGKRQVLLNYGNQLVDCCNAYDQLRPAEVSAVQSVDLVQQSP